MAGAQIHGKGLLTVEVAGQPKNVVVLRSGNSTRLFDVHPLVEAFNKEHGTKLTVVSPKVADVVRRVDIDHLMASRPALLPWIFPADASTAYEKPGTELGNEIVFAADVGPRVVTETGKFKGEKDVALVALGLTSADFAYTISGKQRSVREILQSGGMDELYAIDIAQVTEIRLLVTDRLICVRDFPSDLFSLYLPDAETSVPIEIPELELFKRPLSELSHSELVRSIKISQSLSYLFRSGDQPVSYLPYVGLIVFDGHFYFKPIVNMRQEASDTVSVVAEVPDADVETIKALISQK
ncbi:MAG: hypothetical protein ACP5NX_03960 [Candidatus Bilamarchaeaceae archaeon]